MPNFNLLPLSCEKIYEYFKTLKDNISGFYLLGNKKLKSLSNFYLLKAVDTRTYIAMDIVPLKIVGAKLGNRAGIYGAYCIAKDNL